MLKGNGADLDIKRVAVKVAAAVAAAAVTAITHRRECVVEDCASLVLQSPFTQCCAELIRAVAAIAVTAAAIDDRQDVQAGHKRHGRVARYGLCQVTPITRPSNMGPMLLRNTILFILVAHVRMTGSKAVSD